MQKVALPAATAEIEKWLDHKKVGPRKREDNSKSIDTLIEAVMDGTLTVGTDFMLTHKLRVPIKTEGADVTTVELKYKPRVSMDSIQAQLQNVKATDLMGMIFAYISALSGEVKAVVRKMDTTDYDVASSVASFFL